MARGGLEIRTAVAAVFKYRWRATFVLATCIGMSVAASVLVKTEYTASASVLVKLGRELVYRSPIDANAGATPMEEHDEAVASMIAMMQSPDLEREAVEKLGYARLYPELAPGGPPATGPYAWMAAALGLLSGKHTADQPPPDPLPVAVHRFSRKLKVEVVKRTGILSVSFSNRDPQIAAEAANLVVTLFQKEIGRIYADPNLAFMQQMVDKERAGLDSAQAALTAYQQKYAVYRVDDQINALLAQRVAIDTNLKADAAHMAELQILVQTLAAERDSVPQRTVLFSDSARNRIVDDTESTLLALRVQERQMSTRFAANYPPLVEVRNQISQAQQELRAARAEPGEQHRTGMSEIFMTLDQTLLQRRAELESYAGRQAAMQNQLQTIDTTLAGLSERKRQLADLQQEVDLRTDAVKTSYDKLAEARAVDGLNQQKPSSFNMYQAAIAPDLGNPSKPLPVLYTLIGIVVGLFAAATTIVLSYITDTSFLTPELAGARLRLPVLGVVDYRRNLARLGRTSLLGGPDAGGGAARDLSRS